MSDEQQESIESTYGQISPETMLNVLKYANKTIESLEREIYALNNQMRIVRVFELALNKGEGVESYPAVLNTAGGQLSCIIEELERLVRKRNKEAEKEKQEALAKEKSVQPSGTTRDRRNV